MDASLAFFSLLIIKKFDHFLQRYFIIAPFNGITKIRAFITVNISLLDFNKWKYFVTREQAEILILNLLNKKF